MTSGYWTVHVYTNNTGYDLCLTEIGASTCENTSEPIEMPVDAVVALNNNDPYTIPDSYTYAWDGLVAFMPVEIPDTLPPLLYTDVDFSGEGLMLADGMSMVWGYENARYMGLADFCTTAAEDASFSTVKSLY